MLFVSLPKRHFALGYVVVACLAGLSFATPAQAQSTGEAIGPGTPGAATATPSTSASTSASGAQPPPPYVAPSTGASSEAAGPGGPPAARHGFQMAVRTGYSVPLGSLSSDAGALSKYFSGRVPVFTDLGVKLGDYLFVGGYLGIAVGGGGSDCTGSVRCTGVGVHVGAQIQAHLMPHARANPWVGYGIGIEASGLIEHAGAVDTTVNVTGPEFARFGAGVDFRLSRTVGLGPFADLTLAQYSSIDEKVGGVTVAAELRNKALHEWLSLGVRLVIFP